MACKYKVINEALSNIPALRYGINKFPKVASEVDNPSDETKETTEIYDLGVEDLYIKLIISSDSYGYNEYVQSVQIVKPVIKQVTNFETI